eukprot:3894222-Amphidinium_carterae.2
MPTKHKQHGGTRFTNEAHKPSEVFLPVTSRRSQKESILVWVAAHRKGILFEAQGLGGGGSTDGSLECVAAHSPSRKGVSSRALDLRPPVPLPSCGGISLF